MRTRGILWGTGATLLAGAAAIAWVMSARRPAPPPPVPYRAALPPEYRAVAAETQGDFCARVVVDATSASERPSWLTLGDPAGDHLCVRISAGALELLQVTERQAQPLQRAVSPPGRGVELSRRGDAIHVYAGAQRVFRVPAPRPGLPLRLISAEPQARLTVQKLSPVHMTDDFMRESIGGVDGWTPQGGKWRSAYSFAATSPNPFMCQGVAKEGSGVLLTGYLFWNDAQYSVALKPEDAEEAGIVFAWRDEANHCRAVLRRAGNAGRVELLRVADGREAPLAAEGAPVLFPRERWVRLAVECRQDGAGTVSVDGKALLALPAGANTFGKAGLYVRKGAALFDDFVALDTAEAHRPPPLAARSRVYSVKERYPKDDRDDWLYRWAQDLDAWQPLARQVDGRPFGGEFFHLPFFGDFTLRAAAPAAPARVALLGPEGGPVREFALAGAGPFEFRRAGGELLLDGVKVGALPPGQGALVGLVADGAKAAQSPAHELRSAAVREELFDEAPADWAPVLGAWENTNRWRCKQEWGFFSGQSNECAALFGKHCFDGNQSHLFYYGLRDVFGRQFQNDRYTRHDVNFSFMTDGRDLFSGYTFMYGGHDNKGSYLLRRREVVAVNEKARFPLDQGIEDQHLFWRRLRVDCVDRRIRVRLEDETLIDYAETAADAPRGGHVALWTYRNGVMYARLNSSAESVRPGPEPYLTGDPGEAGLPWRALEAENVILRGEKDGMTRVRNRWGGGLFAVEFPLAKPVDLNTTPALRLRLEIPENVKVNLHVCAGRRHFIVPLTAPTQETYRVLGNPSDEAANVYPDWRLLACEPLAASVVGGAPQEAIRGEWRVDLREELRRRFPTATEMTLTRLVVGNTSHAGYLLAGLSGNAPDAAYALSVPLFEP
jgi:hypothetical protein